MPYRILAATAFVMSLAVVPSKARADSLVELRASERVPFRFVFHSPTGSVGATTQSAVTAAVAEAIESNTDLRVSALEDQKVDQCVDASGARGRLTCLVEESSDAWNRLRKSKEGLAGRHWSELRNALRASPAHARYVLVLSASRLDRGDRMAALVIDIEAALEFVHRIRREGPPTPEQFAEVEEKISQHAVIARPPPAEVRSADETERYVDRLVERDLRDAFEKAGHWRPFGTVIVEVAKSDPFQVDMDGESLGATSGGGVKLIDVRPGDRTISLKNADYEDYETTVTVETGKPAHVRANPIKKPSAVATYVRPVVIWSGVAAAAAGVGLVVASLVKTSELRDGCVRAASAPDCERSPEFLRFGASASPDPFGNPNGDSAPIAPLGYSLIGLGATWIGGPLLIGAKDRIPWIDAIVGAVVFGAAFGISIAADGTSGVCTKYGC